MKFREKRSKLLLQASDDQTVARETVLLLAVVQKIIPMMDLNMNDKVRSSGKNVYFLCSSESVHPRRNSSGGYKIVDLLIFESSPYFFLF